MIQLSIIGLVGKDAIYSEPNGKSVVNFSVAHNYLVGDIQYTTWVKCSWWNPPAWIPKRLKSGTQVWVQGTPFIETYNGNASIKVTVKECEVLMEKKPEPDRFAAMREASEMTQEEPETSQPEIPEDPKPAKTSKTERNESTQTRQPSKKDHSQKRPSSEKKAD